MRPSVYPPLSVVSRRSHDLQCEELLLTVVLKVKFNFHWNYGTFRTLDLHCATLHGHFWAHRPRNTCEGTHMNIYLVRNPLGNPYWRIGPIQGWTLLGGPVKCHSPLRSLRSNVHLFHLVDRWMLWFTDARRTAPTSGGFRSHLALYFRHRLRCELFG